MSLVKQPLAGPRVERRCMGCRVKMTRILVVEDENMIAMELAWLVEDAGYSVLGPEWSVEGARMAIGGKRVDLALLDVNLGGETVFPVSKILDGMGIPFIFITSHSALLPAEYRQRPLMTKPFNQHDLLALILAVLAGRAQTEGDS
jgi:DNA-binding response OmpR family regulator